MDHLKTVFFKITNTSATNRQFGRPITTRPWLPGRSIGRSTTRDGSCGRGPWRWGVGDLRRDWSTVV